MENIFARKRLHDISAFGSSDKGLEREDNQDSIFLNQQFWLFIVADGMGGHANGGIASGLAVEYVKKHLTVHLSGNISHSIDALSILKNHLSEAIQEANAHVFEVSHNNGNHEIMGTTLSVIIVRNRHACIGHVGDSRIYRLRAGVLTRLTKDHTEAQSMVDAGLLSSGEAENHKLSHVLTRAVGASARVTVDTEAVEFAGDDIFLLASDGLFRVLSERDVRMVLSKLKSPEEKARELIERTLAGGAPDNVSVIVVQPETPIRSKWFNIRSLVS